MNANDGKHDVTVSNQIMDKLKTDVETAFMHCLNMGTNSHETEMKANEGLKAVQELYNSNKEYSVYLNEVDGIIISLHDSTKKISSVTKTISYIASQTNKIGKGGANIWQVMFRRLWSLLTR